MYFPWIITTNDYGVQKDAFIGSEVIDKETKRPKKYAILSHRWDDPEVKFNTMQPDDIYRSTKLRGACDIARMAKIDYIWIDSVCMDKTNAVETSRNLNSMFDYYQHAEMCITYLWDVDATSRSQRFRKSDDPDSYSDWFYRGWTLQELLASPTMWFYDVKWKFIGDKRDAQVKRELQDATNIATEFLKGDLEFRTASVATKMSWMAGRRTTHIEDIAYSMLGIFNITMDAQYGEGMRAFLRLQKLLFEGKDESLFAWTTGERLLCYSQVSQSETPIWKPETWGLLAPSPDCFRGSGNVDKPDPKSVEDRQYGWSQNGIQFMVPQKSGTDVTNWAGLPKKDVKFALNCWVYDGSRKPPTVVLHLKSQDGINYVRYNCRTLNETPGAKPSSNRVLGIDQLIRRPLVVGQPSLEMSRKGALSEENSYANTARGASRLQSTNAALLGEFQNFSQNRS